MSEEEKREIRQVANAHLRKKTVVDKAADVFFSEDARTVGETIMQDYVIPGIKSGLVNALEMLLFGTTSRGRRRTNERHVSYDRFYDDDRDGRISTSRRVVPNRHSRFDYMDCEFDTLGEVTDAIEEMTDYIRDYGFARVSNLDKVIGISGQWTDRNWGWNDARDFNWRRYGRKYVLDFAPPIPVSD